NRTIEEYFASKLNMHVINRSFKQGKVGTGVATLVAPHLLQASYPVGNAESANESKLFQTSVGSPFTLDVIKPHHTPPFFLVNTHVRMHERSIAAPLEVLYERVYELLPVPD